MIGQIGCPGAPWTLQPLPPNSGITGGHQHTQLFTWMLGSTYVILRSKHFTYSAISPATCLKLLQINGAHCDITIQANVTHYHTHWPSRRTLWPTLSKIAVGVLVWTTPALGRGLPGCSRCGRADRGVHDSLTGKRGAADRQRFLGAS